MNLRGIALGLVSVFAVCVLVSSANAGHGSFGSRGSFGGHSSFGSNGGHGSNGGSFGGMFRGSRGSNGSFGSFGGHGSNGSHGGCQASCCDHSDDCGCESKSNDCGCESKEESDCGCGSSSDESHEGEEVKKEEAPAAPQEAVEEKPAA